MGGEHPEGSGSLLAQTLTSSLQELPPSGLITEREEVTGLPHSFFPLAAAF